MSTEAERERLRMLQELRCTDLLSEARELEQRALAARSQARAIAKSWSLDLDKLAQEE